MMLHSPEPRTTEFEALLEVVECVYSGLSATEKTNIKLLVKDKIAEWQKQSLKTNKASAIEKIAKEINIL